MREVLVPCTGRIQPEHVLKAFESGATLICAVGCQEDNCHYVEGSKRCIRRVDYLQAILEEIGLGGHRLMFLSLPGTAVEDMALAAGRPAPECADLDARVAAVRDRVARVLESLPDSPLGGAYQDLEMLSPGREGDNDEE